MVFCSWTCKRMDITTLKISTANESLLHSHPLYVYLPYGPYSSIGQILLVNKTEGIDFNCISSSLVPKDFSQSILRGSVNTRSPPASSRSLATQIINIPAEPGVCRPPPETVFTRFLLCPDRPGLDIYSSEHE